MNIYVGNLSAKTTEDDLRQAFTGFGQVRSVNIVRDGATGESRGFGFVSMPVEKEAQTAIDEMNGKDLDGQAIKVQKGRAKTNVVQSRGRRTGFGGARSGGRTRGGFSGGPGRAGRRDSRGRGGPDRRRYR